MLKLGVVVSPLTPAMEKLSWYGTPAVNDTFWAILVPTNSWLLTNNNCDPVCAKGKVKGPLTAPDCTKQLPKFAPGPKLVQPLLTLFWKQLNPATEGASKSPFVINSGAPHAVPASATGNRQVNSRVRRIPSPQWVHEATV